MNEWWKKFQIVDSETGDPELSSDSFDLEDTDLEIEKKWLNLSRIDPGRFAFFYSKYYDPIFRFINVELQDREVAQDLTNEVFSEALENLNRFRWQGVTFGAWLFRIAYHRRARELRRRGNRNHDIWEAETDHRVAPETADTTLLMDEERQILQEALAELAPIKQEIFRAFYWANLKVREIAVIMEISEPSVKAHLQRGRRQLLRLLLTKGLRRGLAPETMKIVEEWTVQDEGWGLVDDEEEDPRHE